MNATDRTRDLQNALAGRDRPSRRDRRRDRDGNRVQRDRGGAKEPRDRGGKKATSTERKPKAESKKDNPAAKAPREDNAMAATKNTVKTPQSKAKASEPYVPGPIRTAPKPAPAPARAHDDPRMDALAEAIREAGKAPAEPKEGTHVYGHMVDVSTPETRATTLRSASEEARKSSAQLNEKADRLLGEANALADKKDMAAAANGLRIEASRARETAEYRVGMAAAYEQVADEFAAERNRAS